MYQEKSVTLTDHTIPTTYLLLSPRLVDIIAAVPPEHKKTLLPKLKAKPVRTASGIAVVAVMCKPHRCPHISMTGQANKTVFSLTFSPQIWFNLNPSFPEQLSTYILHYLFLCIHYYLMWQATSACIALVAPTLTLSTLHSPTRATSPPLWGPSGRGTIPTYRPNIEPTNWNNWGTTSIRSSSS